MNVQKVLKYCAHVFCLLMCVYLLIYSGTGSTDDEQLFVVLTANLADRRDNSTLPLYGNDRIRGEDANIEPLHPLLSLPFYRLAQSANWGRAQALYLPAGIYTAISAALLAAIALRRGYAPKSAVILALTFGLSTIALPYARSNFREPLAALCLTCATYCLDSLRCEGRPFRRYILTLVSMLAFIGLAVLTKLMCILCLPFFIASAWLNLRRNKMLWQNEHWKLLGACVLISLGIAAALFFSRTSVNHSRFSISFIKDMIRTLTRLPHSHFWQALAGMLVSPGKGLLVYSPVLILVFISLVPRYRLRQAQPTARQAQQTPPIITDRIIAFGSLGALMVMQALIYDQEWWNITWGTRVLLPALPLLILTSLPALDAGLHHGNKRVRNPTWLLLAISFFIQLGRILTTDPAYVGWLALTTGQKVTVSQWWDMCLMPLWRHWQLALRGDLTDIVWLHLEEINPSWTILLISVLLLSIIASIYFLFHKREIRFLYIVLLMIVVSGLIPASLAVARYDRRYYGEVEPYQDACDWIHQNTNMESLVLVNAYLKPLWWYSFNFGCARGEWLSLPYLHAKAYSREAYYPRLGELSVWLKEQNLQGRDIYLLESHPAGPLDYSQEFHIRNLKFSVLQTFFNETDDGTVIYHLE